MRLAFILIAAAALLAPFVVLRLPWAVNFWRRLRLVAVVYAIVILVSAIVALVTRWDEIYG